MITWLFQIGDGDKTSAQDKPGRLNNPIYLFVYLFKQFFLALKGWYKLILVDIPCRKQLKGMSFDLAGFWIRSRNIMA